MTMRASTSRTSPGDTVAHADTAHVAAGAQYGGDFGVGVYGRAALPRVEGIERGEAVRVAAPLVEGERALHVVGEAGFQ
jgi:hypothetical protein